MKIYYKEKMGNKRIIHLFGLKIKYSKDKTHKETENNYNERLTKEEWADLYNASQSQELINSIINENYYVQTKSLLDIIPSGSSTLEIGSGTGQSSLVLAKNGCNVTLLDYAQECLELSKRAADMLNLTIDTLCADAMEELNFKEKQFDYIFHAGLLEHFKKEERIEMLKHWKKYCKNMISLVPNASCLAYRVGKKIMEKNGTWNYGIENPLYTQVDDFQQAGFIVEKEYTVGIEHALNFLDINHSLRKALKNAIENGEISEDFHQGYLLVTIGKNENNENEK